MALSVHQKSIYLILFNATMILRSVGQKFKDKEKLKDFKREIFKEIEKLTLLMDEERITEMDILTTIDQLSKEFGISFGQAQKPINVILKYHFYLTKNSNSKIKAELNCPLDSVILKELQKQDKTMTLLPLNGINREIYHNLQEKIKKRCSVRIDFDTEWDKQHLKEEGLWPQ